MIQIAPPEVERDVRFSVDILGEHAPEMSAPVPYLNARNELIIPMDCDPHYHWWKPGGQRVHAMLVELGASPEVLAAYVDVGSGSVKP